MSYIYLVQSAPCLNFPKLYVLYLTVLTPSYWYEQFILNNFLNSIPGAMLSKWQLYLTHTNYHKSHNFFLVFSFPGGGRIGNLTPALLPNHLNTRGGAGGVAGWALPCFPSLLTCGRGRWAGDNPDAWQLYPSYVLRSVLPGYSFPTLVLTHTYIK